MINRYKLVITGRNPDYFLKKIIKKKINIYDLEKSHKKIYIVVDDAPQEMNIPNDGYWIW